MDPRPVKDTTITGAIEQLKVHDHISLIYQKRKKLLEVAIPFIRSGLEQHDRCLYIADEKSANHIIKAMGMLGVKTAKAPGLEALVVLTKQESYQKDGIIGSSLGMRQCLDQVGVAAGSSANVLITGETGTGKELFAWAVHANSTCAGNNFVVVDCAALPDNLVESMLFGYEKGAYTGADKPREGLIRHAHKGTLFLDEVAELPLLIQKAFLRVLQERRFRPLGSNKEVESDFRLIAATNRNLEQMVHEGHFREDLLFRLRSITLEIPPLRARSKDIRELAQYFVERFCERFGIALKTCSPEYLDSLELYDWPGNVRELMNTIEQSLAVAGGEQALIPRHLPDYIRIKITQKAMLQKPAALTTQTEATSSHLPSLLEVRNNAIAKAEREYIKDLLILTGNNIPEAARVSGLKRSRLYELLKKYQIGTPH